MESISLTRSPDPPPGEADIVVVGAGYTGLATAFEAARRGRAVVVFDRDDAVRGASSRSGGMVLPGLKHDLTAILAMENGRALWDETVTALEGLARLIDEHQVECDWMRTGHVELAHHPWAARRFEEVARSFRSIGEDARFLKEDELGVEIGSDRFCGAARRRAQRVDPPGEMGGRARIDGDGRGRVRHRPLPGAPGRGGRGWIQPRHCKGTDTVPRGRPRDERHDGSVPVPMARTSDPPGRELHHRDRTA